VIFLRIHLEQGDITNIQADAIVNAANNELWMGAGVAGAIKRKGGTEIEKDAMSKGPIEHGGAVESIAGKLNAKYVIHAAGMRSDGYITKESLSKSVENSLFVAEKLALRSIAFPAIGTGVAGFPAEECAKIMLDVLTNFKYTILEKVILVLYSDEMYSLFLKVAGNKEIEL